MKRQSNFLLIRLPPVRKMTVNSQEFEETLKKIRNNATGDEVSFWDTGLDEEDCARLCEALKVAIQSNKRDTALSLAHALTLFGWPAYPLSLGSADYTYT